MSVSINNVVTVNISLSQKGISSYNVNNLAIFTDEEFENFDSASYKIYLSATEVGKDFGTDSVTYKMALAVFAQNPNILNGNGYLVIIPFGVQSDGTTRETLSQAILRTNEMVAYYGVLTNVYTTQEEDEAASDLIQTMNKLYFDWFHLPSELNPISLPTVIKNKGNYKTRCLYYNENGVDVGTAAIFAAAYASRGLSTNFSASRSTQTMHLKNLLTISPDVTIDQTVLSQAVAAGMDVYVSIGGVPKVFTSGENGFFDQAYNLGWFVGALEVAGFNALATTSNKAPQTEDGVSILKGAYRLVCIQGVNNGYIAAGTWNSSDRFGDVEAMLRNIEETGFYLYSQPVNQQAQTDREARKAPVIQIAIKEAGAIHSTNVVVNINA